MTRPRLALLGVVLASLARLAAAEDSPAPAAEGFQFVDGAGRGLAGVVVVEAPRNAEGRFVLDAEAPVLAKSDEGGRLLGLRPPGPGRTRLVARRDGYEALLLPDLGRGALTLVRTEAVSGVVRAAKGPPPPRAYVIATPVGRGDLVHVTRLDDQGRFSFSSLGSSRWRLDLRRENAAWAPLGTATLGIPFPTVTLPAGILVRGRVFDGDQRMPAAGLRLRFRPHDAEHPPGERPASEEEAVAETVCDGAGRFVVADLPPGVYSASLVDRLRTWEGRAPRFQVSAGLPVRLETWWVRRRGSVTGVVRDASNRRPIADALARVVPVPDATLVEGGRVPAEPVRTDAEGRFLVPGIAPGVGYRLVVEAKGRAPVVSPPLDVDGMQTEDAGTILLARAWRIEATVVGTDEKPVEGAMVVGLPASRPGREEEDPVATAVERRGTTDAEGRVLLEDLAAGDAYLRASRSGYVDAAEIVDEAGPGGIRQVRLRIASARHVAGRVLAMEGPLPSVVVRARPRDGGTARTASLEGDGTFRLEDLGPSPVDLEVLPSGGPAGLVFARREAVIPGTDELVTIQIRAPERVEGRVEGLRLDGPAGVVRLESTRFEPTRGEYVPLVVAEVRLVASSDEAPFAFPAVPPGPYFLRAVQGRRDTGPEPIVVGSGDPVLVILHLPRGGTVSGIVFDGARGGPALGARVLFTRLDGDEEAPPGGDAPSAFTTDEEGRYEAEDLAPGLWRIDASDEEAVAPPALVRLAEGAREAAKNLQLSGGGRVEGRVADGRRGPVGGLGIRFLRDTDLEEVARARTDDQGAFRSPPLVPGRYRLRVAAGLAAAGVLEAEVDVVDGETTRVEWSPRDVGSLEGTVRRRADAVAGATVEVRFAPGSGSDRILLRAVTDASGHYGFEGLGEGTYEIRLMDGVVRTRDRVRLRRGERITRDLEVGEGRLVGIVTSIDGSPRGGVEILAFPIGTSIDREDLLAGRVRTGPDGTFAVPGLPLRPYRVAVIPPGRPARVFDPVYPETPGSERPLEVVLGGGATLDLEVRDSGGRPVGAASIWIETAQGEPLHSRPFATPGSGRLRIDGIVEPEVRVVVEARGHGRPRTVRVTLREGAVSAARVVLGAAGSLRLTVTSAGEPVGRARVDLVRSPGGEPITSRRRLAVSETGTSALETSPSGVLVVEDLEEGDYTVRVTGPRGLAPAETVVRVRAGGETEARVVLR